MKILGIESSCDETAAAIVEDGRTILSSVVATQIPFHEKWKGVVPEIASRKHVEWIYGVVETAFSDAALKPSEIDAVAATSRPGLVGSLLVGLTFAKAMSYSLGIPFVAVDHILAHLYAPLLSENVSYPFLGLIVSGGHTIIARADDFDSVTILGTTIDDAVGEAFDKVAKFHGFGYPGGVAIDSLAEKGDSEAFRFPRSPLVTAYGRKDVSYSGLKTASTRQLSLFAKTGTASTPENIAASFRAAAVDILLSMVFAAVEDTGLTTVVAGGGVAANRLLREKLSSAKGIRAVFPPLALCGDNGAMVAGYGFRRLSRGDRDPYTVGASARTPGFRNFPR